jgi:hypothetical protein
MAVPKTAMYEDGDPLRAEDDVRPPRQLARVKAKAKTS